MGHSQQRCNPHFPACIIAGSLRSKEKEKHNDVPKVGPTKTTDRQYDRIFGIWVEGVELLRSCTAEPTDSGIFWNVRKDVTKYSSLLMKSNLNLSVYMANIVDKTYTDLILSIFRNLPLNDGLWFKIQNSTDFQMKELVIPRNVYRAVLEIYVSFHENDEFWYTNLDNDYLMANNLSFPGNVSFREVLVKLDDDLVGAVWPFTVIFTVGINPLFWRPISAIESFDLSSYDIEITPFLGKLLDGNPHRFRNEKVSVCADSFGLDLEFHPTLNFGYERMEFKFSCFSSNT
ncbi:peptide-N4-(N-acetyl-beta-glucosaminyl)asparagine amidase A-like [Amaranthus tricolor]|uniref:peptide-N4-(N-acetyl-beta- glucosaminyl)asparagine amidase A-like n=1 Tax=Amaranthus tricolor TaxID=29722 RepID=UPI00258AC9C2|nr:peptide-N4-(N-acetyl-beta-glucosaminyl)asparagine amidase A-like [Amaranthus tricolor]